MSECRCGRETRDDAYVCENCADQLATALGDVPWLDEQLEVTITRQQGIDYRRVGGGKGGKKPAETPTPVHWGASEAKSALKAMLVLWARFCDEERIRHQSPAIGLPDDNLVALSRWLLWRVDGLTLHDIGPEAVDEITDAVANCRRLIDRYPDRQYLGPCLLCDGDMYGTPGGAWATYEACDAKTDAEAIRTHLLNELDDRLCTAAEIASITTYLGLRRNREQVRNLINQWHKRKRIQRESAFGDEPVFRFGIVWRMLVQDDGVDSQRRGA